MNKKGLLFHLLLLGVLLAIGIFLLMILKPEIETAQKGQIEASFMKDLFYTAEKQQLINNIYARQALTETVLQLASKGGFDSVSECGDLEGFNLWNNQEGLCWPHPETQLTLLFNNHFSKYAPNQIYSLVYAKDKILYGLGEKRTLTSYEKSFKQYVYDTSFAIELFYSFDDYAQLQAEAQQLLIACQTQTDLQACLKQNKLAHWSFSSCTEEIYSEKDRQVKFCVLSPHKYYLIVENSPLNVTYNLALDFFSTQAVQLNDLQVVSNGDNFEASFTPSSTTNEYILYYTNWPSATERVPAVATQVFDAMPVSSYLNYFYEQAPILPEETCPEQKQANMAYKCNNQIVFVVQDSQLTQHSQIWFGVAAMDNGQESSITKFVVINK